MATGAIRQSYADAGFADMLRDLWRARLFVLCGALAGLALAAGMLALGVPHYRATMIVGPVAVKDAAPVPDTADPLGFARFEAIMRGPRVAAALRADAAIMAGLRGAARWRIGAPPRVDDDAYMAHYLDKRIGIVPVGDTALRRITFDHPDKAFAAALLRAVYAATDELIHEEQRALAQSRAAQISARLRATDNPDHRRALTGALLGEEQAQMMLAIEQPYAALVAEPPAAGMRPHWPRPELVIPVLVLAGMVLGFALSSLRRAPV